MTATFPHRYGGDEWWSPEHRCIVANALKTPVRLTASASTEALA